jgi:hypothetical protein
MAGRGDDVRSAVSKTGFMDGAKGDFRFREDANLVVDGLAPFEENEVGASGLF